MAWEARNGMLGASGRSYSVRARKPGPLGQGLLLKYALTEEEMKR